MRGAAGAQVLQPAGRGRDRGERPLDARLLGGQGRAGLHRHRDVRLERHQPALEGGVQRDKGNLRNKTNWCDLFLLSINDYAIPSLSACRRPSFVHPTRFRGRGPWQRRPEIGSGLTCLLPYDFENPETNTEFLDLRYLRCLLLFTEIRRLLQAQRGHLPQRRGPPLSRDGLPAHALRVPRPGRGHGPGQGDHRGARLHLGLRRVPDLGGRDAGMVPSILSRVSTATTAI